MTPHGTQGRVQPSLLASLGVRARKGSARADGARGKGTVRASKTRGLDRCRIRRKPLLRVYCEETSHFWKIVASLGEGK